MKKKLFIVLGIGVITTLCLIALNKKELEKEI